MKLAAIITKLLLILITGFLAGAWLGGWVTEWLF